jgi:hypothetical protein
MMKKLSLFAAMLAAIGAHSPNTPRERKNRKPHPRMVTAPWSEIHAWNASVERDKATKFKRRQAARAEALDLCKVLEFRGKRDHEANVKHFQGLLSQSERA